MHCYLTLFTYVLVRCIPLVRLVFDCVSFCSLEGEKVRKAREWGIECVNVRWLSELVLGNLRALKLPLNSRYKTFQRSVDDFNIDPMLAPEVMCKYV